MPEQEVHIRIGIAEREVEVFDARIRAAIFRGNHIGRRDQQRYAIPGDEAHSGIGQIDGQIRLDVIDADVRHAERPFERPIDHHGDRDARFVDPRTDIVDMICYLDTARRKWHGCAIRRINREHHGDGEIDLKEEPLVEHLDPYHAFAPRRHRRECYRIARNGKLRRDPDDIDPEVDIDDQALRHERLDGEDDLLVVATDPRGVLGGKVSHHEGIRRSGKEGGSAGYRIPVTVWEIHRNIDWSGRDYW